MANFNKVILMGNLTRDPELRYTPKGTAVARLGLAVNRVWRTETGEQKEEVMFVDIDAFGRQAETIAQYMKKGRPIFVEGRLRYDTWEDKQSGQKKSKLNVVLESFQFVDFRGSPDAAAAPAEQARTRPAAAAAAEPPPESVPEEAPSEDDVPF